MTFYYIAGFEYRVEHNNCELNGVEKKIIKQLSSLIRVDKSLNSIVIGIKIQKKSFKNYLLNILPLTKDITHVFLNSSSEDVIYIRHLSAVFPIFLGMLLHHKNTSSCKVVFELNAIQKPGFYSRVFINRSGERFKLLYYLYVYVFLLLFEKLLLMRADGLVSVTNEISNYYKLVTENKLKYIAIGNGVSVSSLPLRNVCKYDGNGIDVLIVATVCKWHGVDRFIRGMHTYSGAKTISLHIVGNGPELLNLKTLTAELHLEDCVIFHGFKSGADLDAMFDQCHIAIGGLGYFRRSLTEVALLKNREYCARGIPFFLAGNDIDFSDEWEYILEVPATEDPIDMEQIFSFANRVMSNPNHSQEMREYAEKYLDWYPKMKILNDFLETL